MTQDSTRRAKMETRQDKQLSLKSVMNGAPSKASKKQGKFLNSSPIQPQAVQAGPGQTERDSNRIAFSRYFTLSDSTRPIKPLDQIKYVKSASKIKDTDGRTVFEMKEVEVPAAWSQLAVDILVSKYFRKAGVPETGHEVSVKQVIKRLAHTLSQEGERLGYFDSASAENFEDELSYLLIHQMGAFNSPVWFNLGLYHEYGIQGSGGNFGWDSTAMRIVETQDAYSKPQCSACFIQSVDDDLMSIFQLVKNEARLFKYGSGTGSNFSKVRGRQEKLSGGGSSSGLMSFLEVLDRGAGATKSGGTTRRAAKMVCLDMDHPEIVDFITWKSREEKKVAALIAAGYSSDFNGEAYKTVAGQNSNNSVRVSDEFMQAVETGQTWSTRARTTGEVIDTYEAMSLWKMVAEAAWACADPGLQYDSTINDWHTCLNTARINASNPCVTGDTFVATISGLKRISDLVGKPSNIIASDGKPASISGAFKTGIKPVFLLRTKSGYSLKLTADHKVFTLNRGDVPAVELTKDDLIQLIPSGFGEKSIASELGELVGLAVGDGCISGEILVLAMATDERAVLEKVAILMNSLKPNRPVSVTQVKSCSRLSTNANEVVDELRKWAVLDKGSIGKKFTDAIFNLNSRSIASILRGLFTADGTVANYGDKSQYVSLDSVSLDLLRQVQVALLSFGIKSKLYENRRALSQLICSLPDGKGSYKDYPVLQVHSLRISRSSRVVFEREIGFIEGTEKAKRLRLINETFEVYADHLQDQVSRLEPLGEEEVYDLTEPRTNHFVANGIVVHNCSEYMFLDDTACNLASVNLVKFLKQDGTFDIEGYRSACRTFIIAQEILVDISSYPTERIAQNSHDYRPLGLGYANLGTLLMLKGIPYDSEEGRAWAGALTAIMCGRAYAVSAEEAGVMGPFAGYEKNQKSMLRVIAKHRDAAYQIDEKRAPRDLIQAAKEDWDAALELGKQHGFRNSQVTVLAPTGTIGLLMDCDTTGVEPDFALVKFKKLAGGGYFKIVNQSVPLALKNLGYSQGQMDDILRYLLGMMHLEKTPYLNREFLKAKGFTDAEVSKIEKTLPGTFEISSAFSRYTLGDDLLKRIGVPVADYEKPTFQFLKWAGLTEQQLTEVNEVICGTMTVEGAPHLRPEHLAVFDCANKCGHKGSRFIAPMGHVKMMAATQPFLSGAISKTVNLPHESTVADIEDIYYQGWKLGLKAIALYRDGCKLSQPLSSKTEKTKSETKSETKTESKVESTFESKTESVPMAMFGPVGPVRHKLPAKRKGFTQEATVAGHKVYIRTGEYEDGTLGEVFIDMHKEGAAFRAMMNCFAISVSLGLQYGVPLEEFVDKFTFTRFEPAGVVGGHPNVKLATSIVDYIFRVLGMEYLGRTDFVQVKPAVDQDVSTQSVKPSSSASISENTEVTKASQLSGHLAEMMGDAPPCDGCGHTTVRNGSCYKCLNCGNSMGCS